MWKNRMGSLELGTVVLMMVAILVESTSSLDLTSTYPAELVKLISDSILAVFPRGDFPTNEFPTFSKTANSSRRSMEEEGIRTFSKEDSEDSNEILGRVIAKSEDDKIYIFFPFGTNETIKVYNSYIVLVQTVLEKELYTGHLANVRTSFSGKTVVEWDYLMTRFKPVLEDFYLSFIPSIYSNDLLMYPNRGGFPLPSPKEVDLRMGSMEALINDWAIQKSKQELIIRHNFVSSSNGEKDRIEDVDLPYTGSMTCPYRPFMLRYLRRYAPITLDRVLQYLLLTLRAQCHPSIWSSSYRLFQDHLLSLNSYKRRQVKLNLQHRLFSKPLLTFRERSQLLSAILLAKYSQVFDDRYKFMHGGKGSFHSSEYSEVEFSVLTLGCLVESVVEVQIKVPQHALKIQNALLLLLSERVREVEAQLGKYGRPQNSRELNYIIGLVHFVDNSIYRIFKI